MPGQAPQDSAPGHELGICAADLTALGWVDQDHVAATAAALTSPLCLTSAGSPQTDLEPASHGALLTDVAAEMHIKIASQALAPAIPRAAELLQEPHVCSEQPGLAGSQMQLAAPSTDVRSPAAQPNSTAPAGAQCSRKRAQPEPAEARATQRSGDSAAHACGQDAGLAAALAPAGHHHVPHPESPAWLLQQVASLSSAYTGVPASAAGQPGNAAVRAAALIGRRAAFVLLEDFVAPPDARLAACMIRAGLHSGRCDRMLHLQHVRSVPRLSW